MDRDGVMRWRCSYCSVFRPESEMVWGLGGGSQQWPPWRGVCRHCQPAPMTAKHSPRRGQLSPRRLVPLATPRADLNARSACTRAAASGGSLAAAAVLRPLAAPRRSRDPHRHALVSRFRSDGLHARPKHLAVPGVSSRLQALRTVQHNVRSRGDDDDEKDGDDDEPPPGGYHPQTFFAPKLDRNMMQELLQDTNMTRTELYRLFNRFKALCQVHCHTAALPHCRTAALPPPCEPVSTTSPHPALAPPSSPPLLFSSRHTRRPRSSLTRRPARFSLPPPLHPAAPGADAAVERDARLDRQEDI